MRIICRECTCVYVCETYLDLSALLFFQIGILYNFYCAITLVIEYTIMYNGKDYWFVILIRLWGHANNVLPCTNPGIYARNADWLSWMRSDLYYEITVALRAGKIYCTLNNRKKFLEKYFPSTLRIILKN